MKSFKKIITVGFVLLMVTLSKPVMALGLGSFTDVPNFSVLIGESMYTLDYANDPINVNQINAAVVKNKGDIFIKTDDNGWIKNSDGIQVNKDSVDISTIKYNNGQEIGTTVPATSKVTQIQVNPTITKTGTNTATFTYKLLDQSGTDITKLVPISEIYAYATLSSTISLEPTTGIGTITFNSSADIDKAISISLVANNGIIGNSSPSKISQIRIDPTITKVGTNTATFKYYVLDQTGTDISKTIIDSQISATASVSSTITLDSSTSTGTITYNLLSDVDTSINITLTDKITGLVESQVMVSPDPVTEAPKVSKIVMTTTALSLTNSGETGYALFSVYDQYGNDVTNSALGANVSFKSNAGTITSRYGLLTMTANIGTSLSTLNSVVITGSDSVTGLLVNITLPVITNE